MENSGYVVIGGQHRYHYYGVRESLHAAKMLATANVEYWDNWQGWHTPLIYRMEDCEYREGIPGDLYAWQDGYFPKRIGYGDRGEPYMYKDGKTWRLFREW